MKEEHMFQNSEKTLRYMQCSIVCNVYIFIRNGKQIMLKTSNNSKIKNVVNLQSNNCILCNEIRIKIK